MSCCEVVEGRVSEMEGKLSHQLWVMWLLTSMVNWGGWWMFGRGEQIEDVCFYFHMA